MLETHVSSSARTGSCVVAFTFTTTGWSFPAERFSNAAKSEVSFWKGRQDALARSCGRLDSNVSLRSPTTSDGRSATRAARGSQLQPADVILCTDESPECCGVVDVGPLTCPPYSTLYTAVHLEYNKKTILHRAQRTDSAQGPTTAPPAAVPGPHRAYAGSRSPLLSRSPLYTAQR